jgi:hypothetical protein
VHLRGEDQERDLSWFDWGLAAALSGDLETLLFSEGGVGGGIGRSVYIRKTDGSPAVRLGDGTAQAMAPDGLSVLAIESAGSVNQLMWLPIGAGQPRALTDAPFSCALQAGFLTGNASFFLEQNQAIEPGRTCLIRSVVRGSR